MNHHAQKMELMGQLTAGVAHDFNNLLTAITGFAELLQRQLEALEADDPQRRYVTNILLSGRRAADLIERLLAFSRDQPIRPKAQDLNSIVRQLAGMLSRVIGAHIILKTNLPPILWPVKVDSSQIEQIIVNLVVNARDAMTHGGRLFIETANVVLDNGRADKLLGARPGEYVRLTVRDNGIGIDAEIRPRIFEPFFTTKKAGDGTGLGLAIVLDIVKQYQGDIAIHSEKSAGTAFDIYLPRCREAPRPHANLNLNTELPSGHETILVVEDNSQVREMTRRVLQGQGYALLEAQNGVEALRLAANYADPIHLLLTDVVMPGINGRILSQQLSSSRPQLRTLFVSGYANGDLKRYGSIAPGSPLLLKPFSSLSLAYKVRTVLDS